MTDFRTPTPLGRTGLQVAPLAAASAYGAPAKAYEHAFHAGGVNLFYWGSLRRAGMRDALRALAPRHRDDLVIMLQSYDRTGRLMPIFLEKGLRSLRIDYADLLVLGWHNRPVTQRILDAALELKETGKVRFLAISSHHRPLFTQLAGSADNPFDVFMVRYNAAHRGAEQDVFAHLPEINRPGIIAYTATRWGHLLSDAWMPEGEPPLRASDCYRFALSHPSVDVCLAGPANMAQMSEALETLDRGPLTDTERARIERIGDHVHDPRTARQAMKCTVKHSLRHLIPRAIRGPAS